jgi:hypothetical protein
VSDGHWWSASTAAAPSSLLGKSTGAIDLSVKVPPVAISDRLLRATFGALSRRLDSRAFGPYQPPFGRADHRAAVAR